MQKSRKPLTRERVVETALALAEAEGADALTMRRLGRALGVEAMSLYRHVANRDDLLDALLEALVERHEPLDPAAPWEDRVRAFARGARRTAHEHPQAFRLVALRPLRTPAVLARTDALLQALLDAGLPPERAVEALRLVGSFTTGYLLTELSLAEGQRGRVADPGAYPALVAAGPALIAGDLDAGFDAAIELILSSLRRAAPGR
jgi:TetR/AcrR family transcriptional regulator, tetracycline repressor protein